MPLTTNGDMADVRLSAMLQYSELLLTAWIAVALIFCVIFLVSRDVKAKRANSKQPFLEALRHYICIKGLSLLGTLFRRKLMRATTNIATVQKSFLLNQLKENAETEYGRKFHFAEVSSVEDFQRLHPLTRYQHYAPYIKRMMDGEGNVLSKQQPEVFGVSSGTSGEGNKIIPMLQRQKSIFFLHAVSVLYCCMVEAYPNTSKGLRKSLKIFYNPTWRTSRAGIKVGPNSSTPSSQKSILHMYSTPAAGFEILSEPDALYVHLLFALKDRHLGAIEGNFASLVYYALEALHRSLPDLLYDIRHGLLNYKLRISSGIRKQLENLTEADPARAREIQQAFDEGITGVCKRIWPELSVVLTVDSGSFAPYGDKLRATFCHGVPLYSPVYAATEGLIGINLWTSQRPSRYLPHPSAQFFEFIPVKDVDLDQPSTLLLHQVQAGEEYELVLTNVSGLYRYRLGDVVKVSGFLNQCPVVEFLYRLGQFLNLRGEKTSESLFYEALCEAVARWPHPTIVDYCCAESLLVDEVISREVGSCGPCYHVFVEIEGAEENTVLTRDQKESIDKHLCQKSYAYSSFRKKGSIGVMLVHVLRHGAFHQLRDFIISTSDASINQFKVPRVLKQKSHVEFLCSRLVTKPAGWKY